MRRLLAQNLLAKRVARCEIPRFLVEISAASVRFAVGAGETALQSKQLLAEQEQMAFIRHGGAPGKLAGKADSMQKKRPADIRIRRPLFSRLPASIAILQLAQAS